jgi:hypothetical protein
MQLVLMDLALTNQRTKKQDNYTLYLRLSFELFPYARF